MKFFQMFTILIILILTICVICLPVPFRRAFHFLFHLLMQDLKDHFLHQLSVIHAGIVNPFGFKIVFL